MIDRALPAFGRLAGRPCMADRLRRHVRTAVVGRAVQRTDRTDGADRQRPPRCRRRGWRDGWFAVPLAGQGHRVTVVDPSPDALAALERRAAEARLEGRVKAVQGDAADLYHLLGPESADVVLCHGVLEVVDDPRAALRGVVAVLRPDGLASVLVAQRYAAVIARAVAGHLADARHALRDPAGRWGTADPLPRRFDEPGVRDLFEAADVRVLQVHGVRVLADLVPGALSTTPRARDLLELEAMVAGHPAFRAVAGQLHVLGTPDRRRRLSD